MVYGLSFICFEAITLDPNTRSLKIGECWGLGVRVWVFAVVYTPRKGLTYLDMLGNYVT